MSIVSYPPLALPPAPPLPRGPASASASAAVAAAAISTVAAAAAAVSAAALPVGPGDPEAESNSMYGARSKPSKGKSTWELSFDRAPVPLQVNLLRCRHSTGGSACSLVCLVAPPTPPHRSQKYRPGPLNFSLRVCAARHCCNVAQPPGPSPTSGTSREEGVSGDWGREHGFGGLINSSAAAVRGETAAAAVAVVPAAAAPVHGGTTMGIGSEMSRKGSCRVLACPHRKQQMRLRALPPKSFHTGS
mmetsp:Transcript_548/g.1279  ORF Transcript_548/g.1279 Transcript_548/m.1279 type:complete len:246 (-) Transcript_548:142-879(-)